MDVVKTDAEAQNWFLSHSSGTVIAEREDGEQKECDCYPQAVRFLQGEGDGD